MKKVLITGITGQDGSYLANLLLDSGNYDIYGLVRNSSSDHMEILKNYGLDKIKIIYGDITDGTRIQRIVSENQFDFIYNFAAQSSVNLSYEQPAFTLESTGSCVIYFLEAIQKFSKHTRFFQASSSEVFDSVFLSCDEKTNRKPKSPYGIAKLVADEYVKWYRENYNIFACSGIFFNHESPRRGSNFLTKKIIKHVTNLDKNKPLLIGNVLIEKDWGYAPEYIEAVKKIMEYDIPDDYVIGTGRLNSVLDFINLSFSLAGKKIHWNDHFTKGWDSSGNLLIEQDPNFFRPNYQNKIYADIKKIKTTLNWEPKTNFEKLVNIMYREEILSHAHSQH